MRDVLLYNVSNECLSINIWILKIIEMLFKDHVQWIQLFHQHRDLMYFFRKAGANLLSTKVSSNELSKSKEFQKFKEVLTDAKRVLISTHLLPDGDGLGAEAALFHYLKRALARPVGFTIPICSPKRYKFFRPEGTNSARSG